MAVLTTLVAMVLTLVALVLAAAVGAQVERKEPEAVPLGVVFVVAVWALAEFLRVLA